MIPTGQSSDSDYGALNYSELELDHYDEEDLVRFFDRWDRVG
jgi:hypothetical protein